MSELETVYDENEWEEKNEGDEEVSTGVVYQPTDDLTPVVRVDKCPQFDGDKNQQALYCNAMINKALTFERTAYLVIGQHLSYINDNKLWKYFGTHIERFEDYLKDNNFEVKIAYEYMRVWKVFKDELSLTNGVPMWKLIGIAHLKKKTSLPLTELVSALKELPTSEFRDEIRSIKGGASFLECNHENQEVWARCETCHKFFKVEK